MQDKPASVNPKIKVAILGGGCGAMAAASYLSSTKALREQYEITVYQQGWRLGGKGATGRDPRQNYGDRVYEHGLHMWLGWYENAFSLIREIYGEWDKKPNNPFQTWEDAFERQRFYTMQQDIAENDGSIRWVTRKIPMPPLPGTPGDGPSLLRMASFLDRLIHWLEKVFRDTAFFERRMTGLAEALAPHDGYQKRANELEAELDSEGEFSPRDGHPFLRPARHVALKLHLAGAGADGGGEVALSLDEQDELLKMAAHYLGGFQKWLHSSAIEEVAGFGDTARWLWQFLDFMGAVGLGMIRDVIPHGVASINHENFHDWIVRHGAREQTRWCAFTRAIYDLAFSFEGGVTDKAHANYEAGSALMVYLRVAMGYKDAPMFRMLAGMGDTIFSPIYEVLAHQRGVKFEFFKRARNLSLSPDGNQIEGIDLEIQAVVKGGAANYEPLVDLTFEDGTELPVWPDEPRWDQLENGDGLQGSLGGPGRTFESAWCDVRAGSQRLQRGVDFDVVVLGISIAGVKMITPELSSSNSKWRDMVDRIRTVETRALQLWMNPDLKGLGWDLDATVQTSYAEPLDTWAVMSDVLKYETWGPSQRPASLHYFCGARECPPDPPVSVPDYPQDSTEQVKLDALSWMGGNIGHLWPNAVDDQGQFRFELIHDPENAIGAERFDSQYWRVNVDPSERYVNSLVGTSVSRLKSNESGFANLFLAGDWTVSSVNGGCVEAAVESGMAASRGICGFPKTIPNYPD